MSYLDLRTDLTTVAGVSTVTADADRKRVVVTFVNGSTAIVERDPLDLFASRDSYIVTLSGQRNETFDGRPHAQVIEHLTQLAADAVRAAREKQCQSWQTERTKIEEADGEAQKGPGKNLGDYTSVTRDGG
jgi:hypothetical protein